jgi:hypothetical protein
MDGWIDALSATVASMHAGNVAFAVVYTLHARGFDVIRFDTYAESVSYLIVCIRCYFECGISSVLAQPQNS